MAVTGKAVDTTLNIEVMLQINQKLWEQGIISKETYETAITKIISRHPEA